MRSRKNYADWSYQARTNRVKIVGCPNAENRKKDVPRFDIIAVDKFGKFLLFCHEVRVGSCAVGGKYVLLFY